VSYNGWSNYETWCAALWIDNDEGSYHYAREILRDNREDYAAADALKVFTEETWIDPLTEGNMSGLGVDLLRAGFGEIDWFEIVRAWREDEDEDEDEDVTEGVTA